MKTLDDVTLQELLPSSLQSAENVRQIADACDGKLSEVTQNIALTLIYCRIDTLDETIVDDLAWQFHVDFYDTELTLAQKRALVKSAIKDHKYKGTPWAVKSVVATVAGAAQTEEWFDYSGTPYHFRVNVKNGPVLPNDKLKRLITAIWSVKNTRSQLDGVRYERAQTMEKVIAIPTALFKDIAIGLPKTTAPDVTTAKNYAIAQNIYKEVVING